MTRDSAFGDAIGALPWSHGSTNSSHAHAHTPTIPESFSNADGAGSDTPTSFTLANGIKRAVTYGSIPQSWPCAIATHSNRSKPTAPITHMRMKNVVRDMHITIFANSQLPGIALFCRSRSDEHYAFEVSPDSCQSFSVEVLDSEIDSEAARHGQLHLQWGEFDIESRVLVAIRCVFKPGKHPLLKHMGKTVSANEPTAQELSQTSTLDVLFAINTGVHMLALRHFALVIDLRSECNKVGASFPFYRQHYGPQEDVPSLASLMEPDLKRHKAPPVPSHLHRREDTAKQIRAGITDLSTGSNFSKPCITECQQIIDVNAIALLRDIAYQAKFDSRVYQGQYARQLRRLKQFDHNQVKPAHFHLSRLLVGRLPAEAEFHVDILHNLRSRGTDRHDFPVAVEERLAAVDRLKSKHLNQAQIEFLDACNSKASCGFVKLTGSARTGKTHALAAAAWASALLCSGVTIIGAKTNAAVDGLLGAVRMHQSSLDVKIVRLNTIAEESRVRLNLFEGLPVTKAVEVFSLATQTHKFCRNTATRTNMSSVHPEYARYAAVIKSQNAGRTSKHVRQTQDSVAVQAEMRYLREQADVIVSTTDTLAHALEELDLRADTVILDDAAQINLCDLISSITMNGQNRNPTRLIMAGDPMQLNRAPPSVAAGMNEWGGIFSETMYSDGTLNVHLLNGQSFYLHENFSNMPMVVEVTNEVAETGMTGGRSFSKHGNHLNNAIQEPRSSFRIFKGSEFDFDFHLKPMTFVHVSGHAGKSTTISTSLQSMDWRYSSNSNVDFRAATDEINGPGDHAVARLVTDLIKYSRVPPRDIGIITAYKSDAEKLSSLLNGTHPDLLISTVDSALAFEKDVVIVHTVTFNGAALLNLGKAKRLYTALTRSKGQTLWIGDMNEALKACKDGGSRAKPLAKLLDCILKRKLLVEWNHKEAPAVIPPGTSGMLQNTIDGTWNGPNGELKRKGNSPGERGDKTGAVRAKKGTQRDGYGDDRHYEMNY